MIPLEEIKLSYLPNRRSKLDVTEEPWLAEGGADTIHTHNLIHPSWSSCSNILMNNHISGFCNSVYRKQTFKRTDFFSCPYPHLNSLTYAVSFPKAGTGVLRVLRKEQATGEQTAASVSWETELVGGASARTGCWALRASISSASTIPATGSNNPTSLSSTQRFLGEKPQDPLIFRNRQTQQAAEKVTSQRSHATCCFLMTCCIYSETWINCFVYSFLALKLKTL